MSKETAWISVISNSMVPELMQGLGAALPQVMPGEKVQLRAFGGITALRAEPESSWHAGVAVNFRVLMKSSIEDRAWLRDLESFMPILVWNYKENLESYSGTCGSQSWPDLNSMVAGFLQACAQAGPRRLRRHRRMPVTFRVKIADVTAARAEEYLLANATSASVGGLYVTNLGGEPPFQPKAQVMIELPDVADFGAVRGEVVYRLGWGAAAGKMPGVGIRFLGETPEQVRLISQALGLESSANASGTAESATEQLRAQIEAALAGFSK